MKRASSCKEIQQIVSKLVRDGWNLRPGKKHWVLQTPDGTRVVSVPGSPSDGRLGLVLFRQDIKKALRATEAGDLATELLGPPFKK